MKANVDTRAFCIYCMERDIDMGGIILVDRNVCVIRHPYFASRCVHCKALFRCICQDTQKLGSHITQGLPRGSGDGSINSYVGDGFFEEEEIFMLAIVLSSRFIALATRLISIARWGSWPWNWGGSFQSSWLIGMLEEMKLEPFDLDLSTIFHRPRFERCAIYLDDTNCWVEVEVFVLLEIERK